MSEICYGSGSTMGRLSPLLLSIILALVSLTYAGMGIFGMGSHSMSMDHGMAPVDCVEHCIATTSPISVLPAAIAVPFLPTLAVALLALAASALVDSALPFHGRWREGIGKRLLRQDLATVILRN
jgi:hypothetical protein